MNYYDKSINKDQFTQAIQYLPDNLFSQLITQAKLNGISDQDIKAGMNFIEQLRNQTPRNGG